MIYEGAGILFYKKVKGVTYISLGKRRFNPDKGCWSVPGGKRDDTDIDLLYTAVRETNEEYFLNKKVLTYRKVKSMNLKHHTLTISLVFKYRIFLMMVKDIKPILPKMGSEFTELGWFDVKDLPKNVHWGVRSALVHFSL